MHEDIDKVLVHRDDIAKRVAETAGQIAADFEASGQSEITIIPILTGSIIFLADLIRHLPVRMQIHLLSVSSYPGTSTTSKPAQIREQLTDLPEDLSGRHVLIIDDILDSGQTMRLVKDVIAQRNPHSMRTCVLLRKPREVSRDVEIDYVCFEIPDEFVVGYGLDFDDYYRNLPDIVVLHPDVTQSGDA